ncbi:DUF5819 family protein [Microbacterium sp. NIBRBAC000506063]|uniref:DUF5819 family protein n=1 Tax=Microbacterium sp. NIBRBAC000506063 TaxID=2734618 RepID=UPI001BB68BBA|nr:DUF5819 family protein [Microbacterium sp. NIBRBAC000506063]QTV80237.1 hypothetical protein KAE78_04200 [Microbacterium sp. NIBRBAC000506063]
MLIVLALAATHMFFTAVVNVPYSQVKYGPLPGAAADAYVRPYFVQNYRIFAPNPASEDRELWVRAWVEAEDGTRTETEWINATAVELTDTYRKVLRKQLTIVGAEAYMAAYRGLNAQQTEIVTGGNFHREGDRERLVAALSEHGSAGAYMRASDYVTAYATQVAHALYGEEYEILAVQSRIVYEPVVRWRDRHDADAEPPPPTQTRAGWREPLEYDGQDQEEFARSFLTWLERAGEEAYPR